MRTLFPYTTLFRSHHVVIVDGRAGLLLAYHLWTSTVEARIFVLFRHVEGHPRAPDAVQTTIDELTFERD